MIKINLGREVVVGSTSGGAWLARCITVNIPWRCQGQWFSRTITLWEGERRYVSDTHDDDIPF